jgi:hypothetical protein
MAGSGNQPRFRAEIFPIPDSRFPIPDSRFPIPGELPATAINLRSQSCAY